MRMKTDKNPKSSAWLARVGRLLTFTIILGMFLSMGLYQPHTADAEILTASSPTAIASGNKYATAAYVIMQRFQLDSSTGVPDDTVVTLSTVTISNPGTANVAVGRVFLSTTSSSTMLRNAVEIGRTRGSVWSAGTITTIVTNLVPTSQRSVTTGTPAFIYIVYDMLSTQATRTTSSSVTGIGVLSPDTVPVQPNYSSNVINLLAGGAKATIVNCYDCHGDMSGTNTWSMDGPRSGTTGSFIGSHNTHITSLNIACTVCHSGGAISSTNFGHRNGFINMANPINNPGGTYSKSGATYSFLQSSVATTLTMGTCNNVYCHSNGAATATATPTWGNSATGDCGTCHGVNGSTPASYPASTRHAQHVGASLGYKFDCATCHYNVVSVTTDATFTPQITSTTLHANNSHNIDWDTFNPGGNAYNTGTKECSNLYCHSQGTRSTTPYSMPVTTANWSIPLGCDGCHKFDNSAPAANRMNSGSHAGHVQSSGLGCYACHLATTTTGTTIANFWTHANKFATIQLSPTYALSSATYSGIAAAGTNSFQKALASAYGRCSSTYCHGSSGSSPTWGNSTTNATCVKCHGVPGASQPQYNAETRIAAPGFVSTAPVGTGLSTAGAWTNTDVKVGAHDSHLRSVDGMSKPVVCTECHNDVLTTSASFTGHMNGSGTLKFGTLALTGGNTPTYIGGNCTNNYCHTANRNPGAAAGQGGLNWSWSWSTPTIIGTSIFNSCTNKCHAMPPGFGVSGDTHQTITQVNSAFSATVLNQCSSSGGSGCHPTITAGGTSIAALFTNGGVSHINGSVEGGTCPGCHASYINSTLLTNYTSGTRTRRDPVKNEFGLAWGHKTSKRGAVDPEDCIVCHLEGDGTSHQTSTYHKNGYIDLRDPDGVGEAQIRNIASTAVFSFVTFTTRYTAGSRTANGHTLDTVDNVVTQKFCLACHDANGATNPTAWTTYTTGTIAKQYMPFGGVYVGATYTLRSGASTTGGLIDVKSQFNTTNSSVHPVRGPLNRDFPTSVRLTTPYNGQIVGRVNAGAVKTNSVVINCFDCHNNSAATGTLLYRTNVAHGATTTPLRGTVYDSAASLCKVCHTPYTSTTTHGPGSAWSATGSSHNVSSNCHACHAGQGGTARLPRPYGAQDYHGYNSRVGGGLWPTVNSRPYAFIRGWSGTAYHRPFRASEFTTGSATCGTGPCPTGQNIANGTTTAYTPGGSY